VGRDGLRGTCGKELNRQIFIVGYHQFVERETALIPSTVFKWGRDSSVGIATRYGLDGPGGDSRWGGRDIPHPSRPALGAHPASYTMGTGSLSRE